MLLASFTMVSLKSIQDSKQKLEQTPNLASGMRFTTILGAEFTATKYKNAKGEMQENVNIVAIKEGDTTPTKYHSTAKAIVDILREHFKASKEPLEKCEVVEERSKDNRLYLTLKGY